MGLRPYGGALGSQRVIVALLLSSVMTLSFLAPSSAGLTLPFRPNRVGVHASMSPGRLVKSPERVGKDRDLYRGKLETIVCHVPDM
jgi:hypothetical protein